jgi:hypothetical protein
MGENSSNSNLELGNKRGSTRFQKMQRAASFSSRKSLSLMVQNANIQVDKLGGNKGSSSCDLTATTAGMDTSAESGTSRGTGNASALSEHRRRRRMLQRVESSKTVKSANARSSEEHQSAVTGKPFNATNVNRQGLLLKQQSFVSSRIRTLRN